MKDAHPKKEDGVVKRKICFHWSGNCCRWSVDIDVRNCGSHYVYKLVKPPACYLRFCGDKGHSKYKMIAHLRNLVGLIFFKEKQNAQQQHSKNLLKLFLCSPNILCVVTLVKWKKMWCIAKSIDFFQVFMKKTSQLAVVSWSRLTWSVSHEYKELL